MAELAISWRTDRFRPRELIASGQLSDCFQYASRPAHSAVKRLVRMENYASLLPCSDTAFICSIIVVTLPTLLAYSPARLLTSASKLSSIATLMQTVPGLIAAVGTLYRALGTAETITSATPKQ